jgi:hypothetical protein
MNKIKITAEGVSAIATLTDNSTAKAIWEALPLEASANTWGDEIYFEIPVSIKQSDDASDVVEMGSLGYWPPGKAFCIFFGPTPASRQDEIRAASPVNPFGSIDDDPTVFKQVPNGAMIKIEKAV